MARRLVTALALALGTSIAPLPAAAGLQGEPVAASDDAATSTAKKVDSAKAYRRIVARVADMVNNERAQNLVAARGLSLLDVTWEDTGRWEGSSVGPNISDVTIEVEGGVGGRRGSGTFLMPVMRHDNFTDKTADIKADELMIPIGNHRKGGEIETISLRELLESPTEFLSDPGDGEIKTGSLLAKRDSHVLVSAQHAFLPVPQGGSAKFWPVVFNYQSSKRNPAVLAILVTRQGTSMTIIDNDRDSFSSGGSWGQRLYFNDGGERAPLMAERLADVEASGVTLNGESAESLDDDSNVLMLIQVPLKLRRVSRPAKDELAPPSPNLAPSATKSKASPGGSAGSGVGRGAVSDVDTAVLGHGPSDGEFTELDGLTIARDTRFPVRVTLQFYQATSNGVISRDDVKTMASQIKKVYRQADFVGSLVVPTEADRRRPTNWTGHGPAPHDVSWRDFPGLAEHVAVAMRVRPGLF